jgi:Uma2 family endonuclease
MACYNAASQLNKHPRREFAMATQTIERLVRERPDLAWEVATLLPQQGHWNEAEYLWIARHTNKLVELSDGAIEVLPMPSPKHQKIVALLYRLLFNFIEAQSLGTVLFAPLSLRLWPGKFREPDILFIFAEHAGWEEPDCWNGADLVMEVVSPSNPDHDLEIKHAEYAQAGIPEYWIVNPENDTIIVLQLKQGSYAEHGVFKRGAQASSALLEGFAVSVEAVLGASSPR